MIGELGHGVDHAEQLDHALDAVEVAYLLLEAAEAVQHYELGRLPPSLDIDILAHLAPIHELAVAARPVTRDEDQVAGADCVHEVGNGRAGIGQRMTEGGETLFNS